MDGWMDGWMGGWMVDCERFYGRCKTRGEMLRFDVSADMRMHVFKNSEAACFLFYGAKIKG